MQTIIIKILTTLQELQFIFLYFKLNYLMSSDQQENSNEQQEENQQNSEQQQEDEDEDEDEDDDEQDDDQDDQEEEQQDQNQDESDEEESKQQSEQQNKKLPTFKMPQPQAFKFTSLLSQISSLSSSVDGLISTFHSSGAQGQSYHKNYYQNARNNYKPIVQAVNEVAEQKQRSRIIIMKDQDTQVSMQPQIIIQPTKSIKEQTLSPKPYRISNESEKFLAQLYQQNKKLKRWQNSGHPMNTYMTTFSKNSGYGSSGNWNDKNRQKFQRKEYQKGLFNVEERNKQIDDAIQMLKRQQQY